MRFDLDNADNFVTVGGESVQSRKTNCSKRSGESIEPVDRFPRRSGRWHAHSKPTSEFRLNGGPSINYSVVTARLAVIPTGTGKCSTLHFRFICRSQRSYGPKPIDGGGELIEAQIRQGGFDLRSQMNANDLHNDVGRIRGIEQWFRSMVLRFQISMSSGESVSAASNVVAPSKWLRSCPIQRSDPTLWKPNDSAIRTLLQSPIFHRDQ